MIQLTDARASAGQLRRTRSWTLTQRGYIERRMQYIEEQPVSRSNQRHATPRTSSRTMRTASAALSRWRSTAQHASLQTISHSSHGTETAPTIVSVKRIPAIRSSDRLRGFEQPSISPKSIKIKLGSRDDDIKHDRYDQEICDTQQRNSKRHRRDSQMGNKSWCFHLVVMTLRSNPRPNGRSHNVRACGSSRKYRTMSQVGGSSTSEGRRVLTVSLSV